MEKSNLSQSIRRAIVQEIETWHREGKITESLAESLRSNYDYDFRPIEPVDAAPAPESVQPPPASPPEPRLTLAQTLLSESSIRIALYLGAFLVISAALILAALVVGLRLPILLTVTVLFAAGAISLKRRMPDPSFVLYLVFSALLLVTGGVLADLLNLTGQTATQYWLALLLGMALLWAFSTRLYTSRFFSLTALLALDTALVMAGRLVSMPPLIFFMFLLTISSLIGLGGAFLLKRSQGKHMGLPVFILVQVQQALILMIIFELLGNDVVTAAHEGGLIAAATWLLTSVFVVLCNIYSPNVLYPWIAIGALMPVAWLAIVRPDSGLNVSALTLNIWGAVFAIAGSIFGRAREWLQSYTLPTSAAAIPLLLFGAAIGLADHYALGFGLFLGSAILLSASHVLHNRWWMWATALGSGLVAYFTLFEFPFAKPVASHTSSQLAGATLLLLLPEVLLPSGKLLRAWSRPLRGWSIITGSFALLSGILIYLFGSGNEPIVAVFTLGILGIFYLAFAILTHRPRGGELFAIHITVAVVFGIDHYGIDAWLPLLAALSVLFCGCGLLLRRKNQPSWSLVSRRSGLVLAGMLATVAFAYPGHDRSIYVFVLGSLFLVETFQTERIETIPPIIYSLAFCMALSDGKIEPVAYYSTGIALLFLGLDLLYTRMSNRTDSARLTRLLGGFSAGLTVMLVLFVEFEPAVGILVCASLGAFFVLQAQVYRQPRLGYSATLFFSLAILFADLNFIADRWLWSMILTALVYFGLSILMERLARSGWGSVLRESGLALASLTALSAPFERSGLIASLPVAIAATLWAVEAFRRKNVWLGFPANGLYLMSYFMILATLRVEQAQFYSIGVAVLGILMHYILVRSGSRTGAFVAGMFSQLTLIGTSYIQFVGTEDIWYFVIMFLQSLVVLIYGVVVRSRSLVITPIALVIIGVVTVIFSTLRGISTVILIGCTGIGLILLGITALSMRERITELREQLKDWLP
jgi:hypothetical protein